MHAMIMRALGEPEQLELTDLPDREPGPGEISIDVAAIGCNFADVLMCRGKYQLKPELPFAPGSEVAGRIRAVGAGVEHLEIGQPVAAQLSFGGYASQVVADARRIQVLPEGMPPADACALGIAYQTAILALDDRAHLRAGETLLVHAAAGGVGLATVQLGRALGARVIATASSADKLALAKEHGADEAIDTSDEAWPARVRELTQGRGADVICESIGGDVFERSLKCIAWAGRLLIIGFSSGDIPALKMNRVLLKHISVIGLNLHGYHERDPAALARATTQLFDLYAGGKLRPVIHAKYPLARAAEALAELSSRRSVGKLILEP
ncbi:MAG TPA: NADPH:quinone oxidoreductase family protein [Polyangiales bacterium]|nr:NADPH:quinone oxidoreductase family protein [Polyangiales bacterium]